MRKYTIMLMLSATFILIGWDVFVFIKEPNATISVIIKEASFHYPILAGAWFLLGAHFFWNIREK